MSPIVITSAASVLDHYRCDFGPDGILTDANPSHTFNSAETYTVALSVMDSLGVEKTSSVTITVKEGADPDSGIGKAIIIAGGGAHKQNTLFTYTTDYCNRIYGLLKNRGYADSDIFYLNPVDWQSINGDEFNDNVVDFTLFDPASDLSKAFDQAARGLDNDSQFIFYIHGHAGKESLRITRNFSLSSDELNNLMNKLPAEVQKVIILDTCYSGSFFDNIKGENRTLISSADAVSKAWNCSRSSFSDRLINKLRTGSSLKNAFESSQEMITSDLDFFGNQSPQLDDNFDGIYSSTDGPGESSIYIW